ncbi:MULTISPECIES: LysR family transcriptional regulator [Pseudomonas]|jgi:DNA-binding transcriptional LysR family regulator|uniref:Transcriptional regulator, LysR family n=4 Tax=Pseudomonas syringae group TaxID=136849 RepID=A0AB37ZLY0_PSESX|nr:MULTISPECIES: LysR family transcriptional regulator [Pseudomonas]ALD96557.1 LysR family transcriptional regulator [Pseudomonas syringae UMAF0158]KTC06404.1 LysR family transcriptional regulator [Pseudomonas sp. ICMP 10191]MBI6666696.1 LysR family transcriptional regulator [Pseudomonas syringae]MBI6678797.1 LysR family transcriptional regulator [Pseudomonas syringae]MBI6839403.1 LysR family transcriptional regulator [Pseudomonas syringae]
MQYEITHADLSLVLALVRGRTLARAADLLQVDVSTVFRSIRRLEAALGAALFEKNRRGYVPTDTAQAMAEQAERAEQALAAARIALQQGEQVVSGTVRLTCTDAVLHSLLLPALADFMPQYPALTLELATSNAFANLSRRDADIALRLTNTPPEHLIGRCLGSADYFVCGRPEYREALTQNPASIPWISPDDSMPDHTSVIWRKQAFPGVLPSYRCSNMSAVSQLVAAGLGVAALTGFTVEGLGAVERLSGPLEGCRTDLWLLTRPDCRALRSVQTLLEALAPRLRAALLVSSPG